MASLIACYRSAHVSISLRRRQSGHWSLLTPPFISVKHFASAHHSLLYAHRAVQGRQSFGSSSVGTARARRKAEMVERILT